MPIPYRSQCLRRRARSDPTAHRRAGRGGEADTELRQPAERGGLGAAAARRAAAGTGERRLCGPARVGGGLKYYSKN